MSEVIKQLGVFNNGQWVKVGIGTDADKVDLESNILGQNNVQGTLNAAFGTSGLTGQKVVVTNSSGQLTTSSINSNQIEHLRGVTGDIQTQLNSKAVGENADIKQSLTLTGSIKALPVKLSFKREGQTKGSIGLDAGTDAITLSSSYSQGENFLTLTATSEGQPKVSLLKEPWQKVLNLKDMFRHQEVEISNIQVPAGSTGANGSFPVPPLDDPNGNFIPLAACGYRLSNAVTGGKYNEVNITSCYVNQNKNIGYKLFTRGTTAANINLNVRVLYIRSDFF